MTRLQLLEERSSWLHGTKPNFCQARLHPAHRESKLPAMEKKGLGPGRATPYLAWPVPHWTPPCR